MMNEIPVFVDYLTIRQVHDGGKLPVINGGRVLRIDADGEVEYTVDTRQGLEGSFDSRVEVRCDGNQVEFSGNISRYGRPDNLFGYTFSDSIEKINSLLFRLISQQRFCELLFGKNDPDFSKEDVSFSNIFSSRKS